jgi:NAD(P)H-dependent FMN reductase
MQSRLWVISLFVSVRGVADAATDSNQRFFRISSTSPEQKLTGRLSQHSSTQIDNIYDLFFSSLRQPDKVFEIRFSARTVGSILEQRAIEFRVIHAVDFPAAKDTNNDLTDQFIADTADGVRQASAILLLTPATKESVPALLSTLLGRLADDLLLGKPVLLFATGGLPGHVAVLERALRHELVRLGTRTVAGPSTYSRRKLDHIWQRSPSPFPGRRARGRSRCRSHLRRNQVERAQRILS